MALVEGELLEEEGEDDGYVVFGMNWKREEEGRIGKKERSWTRGA